MRQLSYDATKRGGDVLKLNLLGPFQEALQFFFGGHSFGVFFVARHAGTIAASDRAGKG
ncbi:MAG: hypothetical protein WB992_17455 [Bryobacteraceae bacterium]